MLKQSFSAILYIFKQYLTVLLSLIVMASCGNKVNTPNVSTVDIKYQSVRFDQMMQQIDTSKITASLQQLKKTQPDFLDFYLDTLMGFGVYGDYRIENPAIKLGLLPFLQHKDIVGLMDTVKIKFPDTKSIDNELKEGFQFLKYYFPNVHTPKVVYFFSGLNKWYSFTIDSSIVGVGLDMYLGTQYPFYKSVQIPDYAIGKCLPAYIPVNVFQAVYSNLFPHVDNEKTLLDLMIYKGLEQYFLSKIIPNSNDTTRLGITAAQLKWCEENEATIYNFFIKEQLMYETSRGKIMRYVSDGPFAIGMPKESPANVGTWMGLRIVNKYFEQHPDLDWKAVLKETDGQKILQASKYKPK